MTPEQIERWKRLVEVARWGMSEHKTVIVELPLLKAVDKLLNERVPGWDQSTTNVDVARLEKQWEV